MKKSPVCSYNGSQEAPEGKQGDRNTDTSCKCKRTLEAITGEVSQTIKVTRETHSTLDRSQNTDKR